MKLDAWDKAEPVAASKRVTDIAQGIEGGPVEARYDREGKPVLLRFNAITLTDSPITKGIRENVGERYAGMVQELSDNGWLVVKLPAQAYVDKLGGVVSGIERQI